jgi:hypothetical protein
VPPVQQTRDDRRAEEQEVHQHNASADREVRQIVAGFRGCGPLTENISGDWNVGLPVDSDKNV